MYKNKSILDNIWFLKHIDERKILYISQKYNYSNFFSKLIASLDILDEEIDEFLHSEDQWRGSQAHVQAFCRRNGRGVAGHLVQQNARQVVRVQRKVEQRKGNVYLHTT